MKPFLNLFFVVVLLFVSGPVEAHPGSGHGPVSSVRTWRFADKRVAVVGNFQRLNAGQVQITDVRDRVVSLRLSDLSWIDQNYVARRQAVIEQLNTPTTPLVGKPTNDLLTVLLAILTLCLLTSVMLLGYRAPNGATPWALLGGAGLVLVTVACKKEVTAVVASLQSDPTVVDAAFTPYKSLVKTRWDNTYFYVESTGIPAHNMMVGITNWQQQVPIPQPYTGSNAWSIPLLPTLATTPLSTKTNFMQGAIAIAANGIPIFNPLNNRGEDSYLIGELDQWGGHCGKADDYHYHIPPLHLQTTSGNLPIAYALDGFAVYSGKEPDGSTMLTLDTNHGHTGSNGVYHYHATTTYPYMIGAMRGNVSLDPTTSAPENQITPQAASRPIRPAQNPLAGASITSFSATSTTSYALQYKVNAKPGTINYSWDATKYTFVLTDTDGTTTTQTYPK